MSERKKKILIIDDDKTIHIANKYILKDKYECLSAYNGDEARVILQSQPVDVILLDINIRRQEEGIELLPSLKDLCPDVDVIMVTGNIEVELVAKAMKLGASGYLLKDHSADQLILTIEAILSKRELIRENEHYVRDRNRFMCKSQIIGESSAIKTLMESIVKIRRSKANVIICAETGTGKELVARHIGVQNGAPFVAVDSATITSSMAESILFGHERGAFTGAALAAKGLFEEANGGVIYFDEIANMPLEIQAKLLRVIQEKEVTRVGSSKAIPLDFRVICATNKDLEKLVKEGSFKYDLFERLNVINLKIPPLRERIQDIPLLIEHFLEKYRLDLSPRSVSPEAMAILQNYRWPGNIRELSNLIANLCTMVADQEAIEIDDLPEKIRNAVFGGEQLDEMNGQGGLVPIESSDLSDAFTDPNVDFYRFMHRLEGRVLSKLFKEYSGNISQMSKQLRISRSHLYSKLHSHGIH